MHKSAYRHGQLFFSTYWRSDMKRVLEVGSQNINGSLRDFAPANSEWTGIDFENGVGVDLVIKDSSNLPFVSEYFDVVVCSSVFEHDDFFWLTFNEMVRVLNQNGVLYINAPSNGTFHRFPYDSYRFYPDAGVALLRWGQRECPELHLLESFIANQDEDVWSDFVAVFAKTNLEAQKRVYLQVKCENVWANGEFLAHTSREEVEDLRTLRALKFDHANLRERVSRLEESNNLMAGTLRRFKQLTFWGLIREFRKIRKEN